MARRHDVRIARGESRVGPVRRVAVTEKGIREIVLADRSTLRADYIFSLYGSQPRTELLAQIPVARTRAGYVCVDDKSRTSLPTFFAAGDVRAKHSHQVAAAVQEGSAAAMAANHVLYPPLQRL